MSIDRSTPWLDPEERGAVIVNLLAWGLLKFSNARDLPLKMGGTTDVYLNLRDARNHPEAIQCIAKLYRDPLKRLDITRFVEVPDSVSCFAGTLSTLTNLPYVTIRDQAKEGRVAKATMIGTLNLGERVAIIDDVITDGASKIGPYQECVKATRLRDIPLVVLVDRQQGWQARFAAAETNLHVWAGMTLHDVRRHLVETGMMERCSSAVEDQNPIIIALDNKSWAEVLTIIDQLRPTGTILKVNDLFALLGMGLISDLSVYGRVMVDGKWHDIPNTMANYAARVKPYAPWGVTVHASAGRDGIAKVVKVLEGTPTKVLAITVLTSFNDETCEEVYHARPLEQVMNLAKIAFEAGAHGFVCSPLEVRELRNLYPHVTLVVPGVRSPGKGSGDQVRVDTPAAAIEAGASDVVMGRQLFEAQDPVAEVKRVLKEELGRG